MWDHPHADIHGAMHTHGHGDIYDTMIACESLACVACLRVQGLCIMLAACSACTGMHAACAHAGVVPCQEGAHVLDWPQGSGGMWRGPGILPTVRHGGRTYAAILHAHHSIHLFHFMPYIWCTSIALPPPTHPYSPVTLHLPT